MSASEVSPFADLLRRHRMTAGLTQEELAGAAKLSTRGIAALEGGERLAPRRDTVELLVGALRLSEDEADRFRLAARARPRRPDAAAAAGGQAGDLPPQATRFLGRRAETDSIRDLLLRPGVRLVTLTGAGGTGKTRLGLRVAEQVAGEFADGVRFVELAPISDPELVAPAIAEALGVVDTGARPLHETLAEFLSIRRMLLLLDNFEKVLEAAALVSGLLAASPGTEVLVTSRAPLRLYGEHEFPVPPLPLPDLRVKPEPGSLSQYEVVTLFIERARAVDPGFQVTNDNAAAVAEICHRLDGLPLAVELAAARIRLFPPHALLRRLGDRLALLTGGARDLPARQRTLRGAVDWSYDLLPESERTLFERLSVFAGGRSLEAIEAVCDPSGKLDALGGLEVLVQNNLLRRDEALAGEPRFVMLETLHEYAREKLSASGGAEDLRRRHALWFLAFAEQSERHLRARAQKVALDRLDEEIDNLRAALAWAIGAREVNVAVRLVGALGVFWERRSHYIEGRRWLEAALALPGERTSGRSKALLKAGILALRQSDVAAARQLLETGRAVYEELGDLGGTGAALANLGLVCLNEGDPEGEGRLLGEAVRRLREAGRQWEWEQVSAEHDLANHIAFDRGDDEGVRMVEAALQRFRDVGDEWGVAAALANLGELKARRSDYRGAVELLREALVRIHDLGDRVTTAGTLDGMGFLAATLGSPVRAATLWGAQDALREAIGAPANAGNGFEYDPDVRTAVRGELGEAGWWASVEKGRAMTVDEAVDYALHDGT